MWELKFTYTRECVGQRVFAFSGNRGAITEEYQIKTGTSLDIPRHEQGNENNRPPSLVQNSL